MVASVGGAVRLARALLKLVPAFAFERRARMHFTFKILRDQQEGNSQTSTTRPLFTLAPGCTFERRARF